MPRKPILKTRVRNSTSLGSDGEKMETLCRSGVSSRFRSNTVQPWQLPSSVFIGVVLFTGGGAEYAEGRHGGELGLVEVNAFATATER